MFPKLWRIFSSSFHSHLLPLFLEKKVSTFMLLGQQLTYAVVFLDVSICKSSRRNRHIWNLRTF
ncbi:hypothetical protein LeptoLang_03905 [Leptospira interrogans serovar Icterohaemorrhagiae]|nr:hypothetical protein LeptoLang_03905 [Leptospira interrogans serovar Icterohaemorrhagiae]